MKVKKKRKRREVAKKLSCIFCVVAETNNSRGNELRN